MKKHLNVLLSLSVLAGSMALVSGCGSTTAGAAVESQVPSVKAITLGSVNAAGASGKIAADQSVNVVSKISGKVASVNVEEGAKVKKGDVIVQLETDDLQEQFNQAQAALNASQAKLADTEAGARSQDIQAAQAGVDQAKSALAQAQAGVDQAKSSFDLVTKTYNQARNHYDEGNVTKDELDQATLNYDKAKAAYDTAQAQQQSANAALVSAQAKLSLLKAGATSNTLDALRADVERTQAALNLAQNALDNAAVVSPIDGVIVKKSINAGEMASAGAALLTVVSMDQVKVEVSVPENMVGSIKPDSKAVVTLPSLPGKTFEGTVTFVSPVSDVNNNTFPVKLTVSNPDGELHAGAVANVAFGGGDGESRLEIPKSAVITKDGKSFVYKLNGDTAQAVELQTEEKNQDWFYLKGDAALKANDKIVINPTDKLADGAKVHVE